MYRLGVVSFLNSRPLIAGLEGDPRVSLRFDVPARLPALLQHGEVDVALVPVIDVLRSGGAWRVVSDACIGCDGETMTVRVFSQVPPDRVRKLWVDGDSHTSVALARVLWHSLYERDLELCTIDARRDNIDELESVLLIGDKVVDSRRGSFAYEVDLGGAWRQHTGLPFVFAVWAMASDGATERRSDEGVGSASLTEQLTNLLAEARDRGVAALREIAEADGPAHGWSVELARRYLTRCLTYKLDARAIEGANLYGRLCARAGLVPADAEIAWPEELLKRQVV